MLFVNLYQFFGDQFNFQKIEFVLFDKKQEILKNFIKFNDQYKNLIFSTIK